MQDLTHTFIVLQYVGLWRPVYWPKGWKTTLYDCYTWVMVFLLTSVTLSELVELLRSMDDVETFANKSFMLLTMIGVCGKATNVLIRRRHIIELKNVLQLDPCRPKTEEELAIQHKFDKLVSYGALTGITVSMLVLRSFVEDIPRRTLPYESWLPFEHAESLIGYTVAYTHQIVTLLAGATVNVAFDTLVPGLMLQTCAQFNILKHRFYKMPQTIHDERPDYDNREKSKILTSKRESLLLSQHVIHHLQILKFAKTSNDLFGFMIFLQYTVSTVVLCVSVFELSKMKLFGPEFTSIIMYLACMMVQIFIFCLYGFEVTLESINVCDAIYEMDWSSLNTKTKKSLLTIMVRTQRPVKFTSFYFVTLNLDSFNNLLKLSYSAYNVLQRNAL